MASTLATVKDDGIPPLPPHWIFDGEQDSPYYTGSFRQRVVLAMYRLLCLVTFGEKSLRPLWKRNHMVDARAWEYGRDMLKDRIQHTNIVVRSLGFSSGEAFQIFVGRFASYHYRGLLHHRSTEGF